MSWLVINDRKQAIDSNSDGQADYYEATILSASDYYPFGLEMENRMVSDVGYRFGFNDERAIPQGECLGDIQASEP